MPKVEQLFTPGEALSQQPPPSLIRGVRCVREEVESTLTEFTTWKTQLLSLGHAHTGECRTANLRLVMTGELAHGKCEQSS